MNTVLIITTFFTGIVAGLFFAWTFSVMNGLGKLPDHEFMPAMQSMNREIQNPIFFLFFFGALLLFPICAYLSYQHGAGINFRLVLAAMLFYIAVMAITMVGNVPLNNMLDQFSMKDASPMEISTIRTNFEGPWNRLNASRTVCNMISFLLLLIAMLKR